MRSEEENRAVHVTPMYQAQIQNMVNGMNGAQSELPHQCVESVGRDEGIPHVRDRVLRQWKHPGFAWKALEAMPVRNLFEAAEDEKNTGESTLSAVEEGSLSEKKLVTIVLAFQRWRHSQLKNIIGQELRKVLEEAREDETELEYTEQQLASARANSFKLHNQLLNHEKFDNTTVRQVTATEGSKEADDEIQVKESQIEQLKEKIRGMEEQMGLIDGRLGCLQSEKSDLQAENNIVLRENKELLEQVSCRDKEMMKQVEEMKKLKSLAAKLVEQQNARDLQTHSQEADTLHERLHQAFGPNCSQEAQLTTSVQHPKHEKGNLLLQLHEAEKRADLASTHAEELCAKLLYCTTHDKGSAFAASEMVKHLKKLTQHVRELESTINAREASPSYHDANGSSTHVHGRMERSKCGSCTKPEFDYQDSVLGSLENNSMSSVDDEHAQWIAWKWRWAASSARAELLARKLHGVKDHKQQKVQDLIQNLTIKNLNKDQVTEHKLIPLILSAWRAFTRTSARERKAASRSALLDKMLEALPWWVRRVRDRRQLERTFFQWLVLTLGSHRRSSRETPMKLINLRPEESVQGRVNANVKRGRSYQMPSDSQTRALQTLQTTLQQEVGELKKILCQDIQPLQRNSQMKGRLVTAPTASSFAKQRRPDGRKVLKSVLGVCNNLALALTNVKGKLSPHVRASTLTLRTKLSPRILADTVNSCIRSEQTIIKKGAGSTSLPKSRLRLAPVMDLQEPCSKKHLENTRKERRTTDLELHDSSVDNRVSGDGAKSAPSKERKLIESTLARLVSTKISKLRQAQ